MAGKVVWSRLLFYVRINRVHTTAEASCVALIVTQITPKMKVFNLRILDSSIRDVTACLSDSQKADVLLHALQHLPPQAQG